jgi:hypothetical protein
MDLSTLVRMIVSVKSYLTNQCVCELFGIIWIIEDVLDYWDDAMDTII